MAPPATAWNRRARHSLESERMREGLRHTNKALRCFDEGVYTLMRYDSDYWKPKAERERRPTVAILLYLLTGECFTREETGKLVNAAAKWRRMERCGSRKNRDLPCPAPDGLSWFLGFPTDEARLLGEGQTLEVLCVVSKSPSGKLVGTTTTSSSSLLTNVGLNPRLFSVLICGSSDTDVTAVFDTVWEFTSSHSVRCFTLASDHEPCFSGPWRTGHASLKPFPLHTFIEAATNCERISLIAKVYSTSYVSNCIMATRLQDVAPIQFVMIDFILDLSMRTYRASDTIPMADVHSGPSHLTKEGVSVPLGGIQNTMANPHILNHLDQPNPSETRECQTWLPPDPNENQRPASRTNDEWTPPCWDQIPIGLGLEHSEPTPAPWLPSHAVAPRMIAPQPHIEPSGYTNSARVADLHEGFGQAQWYVPVAAAQGQSGYNDDVSPYCVCQRCMDQQALYRPFKSYTLAAHTLGGM